jgi:integrase
MNRSRKTHKGLPRRVYAKNGAWKFLSPVKVRDPADGAEKFWIKLATFDQGEPAMLAALARLLGDRALDTGTMPHLCSEFKAHRVQDSDYGAETKNTYSAYLDKIADDFEAFQVADVTTKDWSTFLRNHYKGKANTARKITALAVNLFVYGISELGLRADNPIEQVDLKAYRTKRRTVIPTHEQVAAIRKAGTIGVDGRITRSGPTFECLVDITYLCWLRATEVRALKESQIETIDGQLVGGYIRFKPSKTQNTSGLAVSIRITPEIADVIERARAIKKRYSIVSGYLFPATSGEHAGQPYAKTGLGSMWDRARQRAKIADGIQFKDLRALGATDAAKKGHLKGAIKDRLVHTSEGTTDIYIKEAIPTLSEISMPLPWKSR